MKDHTSGERYQEYWSSGILLVDILLLFFTPFLSRGWFKYYGTSILNSVGIIV